MLVNQGDGSLDLRLRRPLHTGQRGNALRHCADALHERRQTIGRQLLQPNTRLEDLVPLLLVCQPVYRVREPLRHRLPLGVGGFDGSLPHLDRHGFDRPGCVVCHGLPSGLPYDNRNSLLLMQAVFR
jgi:hypothetical protein